MKNINFDRIVKRKKRVSANIKGTKERPRISIFRSNRYIYAQAIDDTSRKTVVAFSSLVFDKQNKKEKIKKSEEARKVGVELAKRLLEKNIKEGIFDRSVYTYLGRVKLLAEGLREGGLKV